MTSHARRMLQDRKAIEWKQLAALVRSCITDDPSCSEWKGRIVDRLIAGGWRLPHHAQLNRAMDLSMHLLPKMPPVPAPLLPPNQLADPTIRPRSGDPSLTTVAALLPATGNACGCCKPISGHRPLRCSLATGHSGDHGMHAGTLLFVRWARSADD